MKEKLSKIGLNNTEIDIYLAILENGKVTPSNLSKITGVNRTTVYATSSELIKKAVITEDSSGKTKYFVALSPEKLRDYTVRKIDELKKQEEIINNLLPELELLPKSDTYSIPKIQFINGPDIEKFLYKRTMVWEKSMIDINGKTWWGFQDHTFVEVDAYRKWILWYWERAEKSIDLKLFTNQSNIEEEMKEKHLARRQIKIWKGDNFASSQWIMGEYIVSIVTRNKLHYLVEIRDRVLADSMRNFTKRLWEVKGD